MLPELTSPCRNEPVGCNCRRSTSCQYERKETLSHDVAIVVGVLPRVLLLQFVSMNRLVIVCVYCRGLLTFNSFTINLRIRHVLTCQNLALADRAGGKKSF